MEMNQIIQCVLVDIRALKERVNVLSERISLLEGTAEIREDDQPKDNTPEARYRIENNIKLAQPKVIKKIVMDDENLASPTYHTEYA